MQLKDLLALLFTIWPVYPVAILFGWLLYTFCVVLGGEMAEGAWLLGSSLTIAIIISAVACLYYLPLINNSDNKTKGKK